MRQLGDPGRAQVPDPAVEDRRQRAREAGLDAASGSAEMGAGIETAIEVATRVQITDEIIEAMGNVTIARGSESLRTIAEAAFRAAGLEVEQ